MLRCGRCLEVVGFVRVGLLPGARTSRSVHSSSELLCSGGTCPRQGARWAPQVAPSLSILLVHRLVDFK